MYKSRLLIYDAGDTRTTWVSFWKAMALLQFGTTLVFAVPPLWNNENQPDPRLRKAQAILGKAVYLIFLLIMFMPCLRSCPSNCSTLYISFAMFPSDLSTRQASFVACCRIARQLLVPEILDILSTPLHPSSSTSHHRLNPDRFIPPY